MNREQALALVKENLKQANLVKHCLAVEACMRAFAQKFGTDEGQWGLAGLLHDLDYDYTVNDPDRHTLMTEEMLRPYQIDGTIIHAIKAHNGKADLASRLDLALYAIDPTSGFITACALMHPDKKLSAVNLERMKKRFKEKAFAKGANREQMAECAKMGVELDEFLGICLTAMQGIGADLGV